MKTIFKWILFFAIWTIGSLIIMWGSAVFTGWIFPLENLKDWIVAIFLFVPLTFTFLAQAWIAVAAMSASPSVRAAAVIVFVLSITSIPMSLSTTGMPDNPPEWVQLIQLVITILTAGYMIKNPDAAKTR